jgi:hypothetical protein
MSDTEPHLDAEPDLTAEITCAIADTSVLLEYLGRSPDTKLQGQFQDANPNNASLKLPIKAPCDDYKVFLNELSALWVEYKDRGTISGNVESLNLSKLAFLFWSRDFLAFIAGPATATSIRFTRDYIHHRFKKNKRADSSAAQDLTHDRSGVLNLVNTMQRVTLNSILSQLLPCYFQHTLFLVKNPFSTQFI